MDAQTFVDAHCSWAAAKRYVSKIPMTAVDLLHERVLPVSEQAGIALERVLTDNGRECCGRPLAHPYELSLAVQQVEHRNTKGHSPQTNGFCERFHRMLKDEFFSVQWRKKILWLTRRAAGGSGWVRATLQRGAEPPGLPCTALGFVDKRAA